jgi:hypothetical protein
VLNCEAMDTLRSLLVRFQTVNPLLVTSIASAFMLALVALSLSQSLGQFLNWLPAWADVLLVFSLLILLLLIPSFVITATAVSYISAHLGLRRLITTFLALVLLFADSYFVSVVVDDRGGTACDAWQCKWDNDIPMQGVHPAWRTLPGLQGRSLSLTQIGLAYIDCFHYSVVTGSTVGFGDIHPARWYAKLMTDLQILLSLGLTVLGVSRLFASQGQPPRASSTALLPEPGPVPETARSTASQPGVDAANPQ